MKKFNKVLALCLALVLVVGCFAACGETTPDDPKAENIKVALICLHGDSSTYDKNFIDAFKLACENKGLTADDYTIVTDIPEDTACYDQAADLAESYDLIFADSFGHESHMIKAAKEFPEVEFCHATGTRAHTENLPNFHNAFASIYEGRYLAGVAAGMKLNQMIQENKITADQAVMGYVGAYPYAEVKSGYTAFYLGAKFVCPSVTMMVDFTNDWYKPDAERDVANSLMDRGAVLISQHADSLGAPSACEARKVPNVSYNGSTVDTCPETFIVSSRIDWTPYFEFMVNSVVEGKDIPADWTGTLATGSVALTDINTVAAAPGTAEKIADVKAKLISGEVKVFDTNNFTVKNEKITTYKADVDTDKAFTPDTEAVENGVFYESKHRSAPYFDIDIDGITILAAITSIIFTIYANIVFIT